jgi:hypothetical protein
MTAFESAIWDAAIKFNRSSRCAVQLAVTDFLYTPELDSAGLTRRQVDGYDLAFAELDLSDIVSFNFDAQPDMTPARVCLLSVTFPSQEARWPCGFRTISAGQRIDIFTAECFSLLGVRCAIHP